MKNLFSTSSSKRKSAIIIASFVVFAAVFGFLLYEGTKTTVALTIDGQQKEIRTHANTVEEVLAELNINLRSEDYLFPTAETKLKDDLKVVWKPAKQVELVKDDQNQVVWTTADTIEEFLKEQKIVLNEHDQINQKLDAEIKKDMKIAIEIAFSLKLVDGGKEKQVWSTSTTVADFLAQQGITLNELDRVEPGKEDNVTKDIVVNVIRVEKVTDVVEEPIKFAVVTKNDSSLNKGTEKTITPGQEGIVSKEYEVIIENGVEVSRKLISEKTLKEKQDKVVAVGTKVIAQQVSRGDIKGKQYYVSSTAYTANCNGCSGYTATGINLRANPNLKVIAVDPRFIPLGTKVYVEGYGHAIAGDTGSAIKGQKIDVFFATKAEAYRWGNRTVKITILE